MEDLKKRIDEMYATRQEFAQAIGVSPSGLSRMLRHDNWKADAIEKSVKALDISVEDIPKYFFSSKSSI